MTIQENLIAPNHHIDMDDIVRDAYEDGRQGDPTLRQVADAVEVPLRDEDILLGEKMMEFLRNSQDPVMAEKMGLRGGVGLAANQLGIAKKIIACLVPNDVEIDDEGNEIPPKEAYKLQEIMYNAKIVRESVQEAALKDGEGCLSVDREVPGFVVRKARVTVSYVDKENNAKELKLRGFSAMCVQHEIDHTNGVMFYDRINPDEPWSIKDGMLVIE